jgi:DNA-binding CsgD family transcriptional regulator
MHISSHKVLSGQDALSLLEVIQASVRCLSEEQLKELILGMRSLLPFDSAICIMAKVGCGSEYTGHFDMVNVSFPEEWLDLYLKRDFQLIDPIVEENFSRFEVQYWADTFKKYDTPKYFIDLAHDFNLSDGYACGTMGRGEKEASLFSFGGALPDHPRTRAIIETLSPHLHQALSRIVADTPQKSCIALSAKEKEILNWIKQGKSSWDISMILGISERTVKFHVSSAMGKLNAVNRSHAVAVAMSMGLIEVG